MPIQREIFNEGIVGYDLKSVDDRVIPFDYDSSGKLDHLVLYRPGTGTIWILKNRAGTFQAVYHATATSITMNQRLTQVNGWVQVAITRTGLVTFSGHVHNDAAISEAFQFGVRVVVGTQHGILVQHSGSVGGTGAPAAQRNDYWTETEQRTEVAIYFDQIISDGKFEAYEQRKGAVTSTLVDIANLVLNWTTGAGLGSSGFGALIFVGSEAYGLASGNLNATSHVVEGVLSILGPGPTLWAMDFSSGIITVTDAIGQCLKQN